MVTLIKQHVYQAEMREKLVSTETWKSEAQAEVASLQTQLTTERSSAQAQLLSLKKQLKVEHVSIGIAFSISFDWLQML